MGGLPPRPPDLRTKIEFNFTDARPNPIDTYADFIEALFRMSLKAWHGYLDPVHFEMINSGRTFYAIHPLAATQLRTNYIFEATVELLIATKEIGWYSAYSQVFIDRRLTALIVLAAVLETRMFQNSTQNLISNGSAVIANPHRRDVALPQEASKYTSTNSWRTIVNPQMLDEHVVRWRYEPEGGNIQSHELFMMIVDGLAEVAQHHYTGRFTTMDAIGPSGIAVFYMAVNTDGPEPARLYWYQVAATLAALALEGMIPARKFAEIEFELLYRDRHIARGYIIRRDALASASANDIATTA